MNVLNYPIDLWRSRRKHLPFLFESLRLRVRQQRLLAIRRQWCTRTGRMLIRVHPARRDVARQRGIESSDACSTGWVSHRTIVKATDAWATTNGTDVSILREVGESPSWRRWGLLEMVRSSVILDLWLACVSYM